MNMATEHSDDVRILAYDLVCAAGTGIAELDVSIRSQTSGLTVNDFPNSHLETWIGKSSGADGFVWTDEPALQCRNNALASICLQQESLQSALRQLIERFGSARIGVIIGSSTAGIDRTEVAYQHLQDGKLTPEFRQPKVHNPHSPAIFVAHHCKLKGPAVTINTACSSSAKVFASAARWLRCGFVDAVLVGGMDSLCLSVIHGFHSLQLVSTKPCKPFDNARDGINLGEAAGFAFLCRAEKLDDMPHSGMRLAGYGESSDAHHMSHPHPEGEGARQAIESALKTAGLASKDIDYINLHGTASQANDLIEGKLVGQLFGSHSAMSSTKGWTGHTLGAAGITEAIISMEAARNNLVPGTLNLESPDAALDLPLSPENQTKELHHVMSNSFGFGGNNCCLIFSKVEGI